MKASKKKSKFPLTALTVRWALLTTLSGMSLHLAAQGGKYSLAVRVPFQAEFQKVEIVYGPDEIQRKRALNFGLDAILAYKLSSKLVISTGVGYFRHRFNIRRLYDHQALNPRIDSLPYASFTENYDYHLLRVPIGIRYLWRPVKISTSIAIEYAPGFAFTNKYNGHKLFSHSNQKLNERRFFSHSMLISARIPLVINRHGFTGIEPYVRILHSYKKDRIFFEQGNEGVTRLFDAIGMSLVYQFQFQR